MQRGEVWWAQLEAPAGRRPVVLLSRDRAIQVRQFVTIAEITRTTRRLPTEVPLSPSDGLPKPCVVNVDTINTISKVRFLNRICLLRGDKMAEISRAVRFALGLE